MLTLLRCVVINVKFLDYSLVLYRTRSLAQCILAHAVTNLALAIYVIASGKWYFW